MKYSTLQPYPKFGFLNFWKHRRIGSRIDISTTEIVDSECRKYRMLTVLRRCFLTKVIGPLNQWSFT